MAKKRICHEQNDSAAVDFKTLYVSLLFYLKLNNSVNNVKSNCGVRERRDPRQQIIYVSTSKSTLHFHVLCVEADILRR